MKNLLNIILCIAILVIIIGIYMFFGHNDQKFLENLQQKISLSGNLQRYDLKYKDSLPKNVSIYSASDKKVGFYDLDRNTHKVLFYFSGSNERNLQSLEAIHRIMNIYKFSNISYYILWIGSIPTERIEAAGIDMSINYYLKDGVSLGKQEPNAFLVDENNKVEYIAGDSFFGILKEIHKIGGGEDLRPKAYEEILSTAARNNIVLDENKQTMLMFVNANCRRCREIEEVLKSEIPSVQKKVNILTLRPDFDTKQNYDVNMLSDDSLAFFNVYSTAAGVQTYPIFVAMKNNKIEKVMTDIKEALEYVKGL